jgi:hypothetical protein
LRDPGIDAALDAARRSLTDDEAIAAAEEVNRIMAEQCYNIPLNWLPWAVLATPALAGFGQLTMPEGAVAIDSQGQYWMHTLYFAEG